MFRDRVDAGRRLGERVRDHLTRGGVVPSEALIVGLPRGGVPVAAEVARALGAAVDVIVVRKIGLPWHRELAMGAIGEDGAVVVNDDVVRIHRVSDQQFADAVDTERSEVERRARRLRGERPSHPLGGRVVVVVDDGIATGATARAACHVARARGAARVVLAVPVAPPGWAGHLGDAADDYVALDTPEGFQAVGAHYADFAPVTDREVVDVLAACDVIHPAAQPFEPEPGERDR